MSDGNDLPLDLSGFRLSDNATTGNTATGGFDDSSSSLDTLEAGSGDFVPSYPAGCVTSIDDGSGRSESSDMDVGNVDTSVDDGGRMQTGTPTSADDGRMQAGTSAGGGRMPAGTSADDVRMQPGTSAGDVRMQPGTSAGGGRMPAGTSADDVRMQPGTSAGDVRMQPGTSADKGVRSGISVYTTRHHDQPSGIGESSAFSPDIPFTAGDEGVPFIDPTERLLEKFPPEYMDASLKELLQSKPYLYLKGNRFEEIDNQSFARNGFEELRLIIKWSQNLPAFIKLDIHDQMAMLRSAYMGLMILRLSFRSLDLIDKDVFRFAQEHVLSTNKVVEMGWSEELAKGTQTLMQRLMDYKVDLMEFCGLMAVLLTYPDATGIKNAVHAVEVQSRFLECLHRYMQKRENGNALRFKNLLLVIPLVQRLSRIAHESYQKLMKGGFIHLETIIMQVIYKRTPGEDNPPHVKGLKRDEEVYQEELSSPSM